MERYAPESFRKFPIYDLAEVNRTAKQEGLDVCVVSYGGSCSNQIVDVLEKNGYKCRTPVWNELLCHCPNYIELDIPIIYIYHDIIKSYLSMKRRGQGWWDFNQRKLANNRLVSLSDENLLKLMIRQRDSWVKAKSSGLLVIQTKEIFKKDILNKLQIFLKNNQLK